MEAAERDRAVAAARSTASDLDLAVDAAAVLNDSNRLVVRLLPCDTVARVTPLTHHVHHASAEREVDVVHRLATTDSPVAALDARVEPRVRVRDGFSISLWTYVEPAPTRALPPAEYAEALGRLHAGMRPVDAVVPHVLDRVAGAQEDVANREVTPDLADPDRALLADTLHDLRRAVVERRADEQLLHGEPHPWNVLDTKEGLRFIDFENTSRGPVEYDLAWAPKEVGDHYPDVDQRLLGECRGLVLAIITMHRWRVEDHHPSGREGGVAFLQALRNGPPWRPDAVTW